jgi:acyl-CoA dehydrogenase
MGSVCPGPPGDGAERGAVDVSLTEEQRELTALATTIFTDRARPERIAAVEAGADRIDRDLWRVLADAGLLGLALAPDVGGGGAGLLDLCLLLECQGRAVAPVPLAIASVAAMAVDRWGSPEQRARWSGGAADGSALLTCALEPGHVTLQAEGPGLVLSGALPAVPAAQIADRILVPIRLPDRDAFALLDPAAPGCTRTDAVTTNRQLHGHLTLDRVRLEPADLLPCPPEWLRQRAVVAHCAVHSGVAAGAVALLAGYTSQREQFGRPLATFQAVAMRAADAYIDVEGMRLTMLQAAWRLDQGLTADPHVSAAAWWAAEAGHRVVHAALHLHGGLGNDLSYPLHRYFLWGRQLELVLGGAAEHLTRLADMIDSRGLTAGGD